MRITGEDIVNTISKPTSTRAVDSQGSAASARRVQQPDAGSDGVDLGGQSGLLAQAQGTADTARAARIEQLRALVASGKYEVDTKALSQAIVSSALSGY